MHLKLNVQKKIDIFRVFLKTASRFGRIGLFATLIHICLVWILLQFTNYSPYFANLIGFSSSFIFAFSGHYFFSFQNPGQFIKSLKRFFLIALFAFFINNALLALLLNLKVIGSVFSTILSVFVIPIITFLSSYFWGFKSKN